MPRPRLSRGGPVWQGVEFDDRNTREKIAGTDIACPEIDDRLLRTYFDWFVESGFLEPPPSHPRPVPVEPAAVGAGAEG
jgi:hypothetical protein